MSITYVNKNSAVGKVVSLTGVTAGNLIVLLLQWQDNAVGATVSDGSSTFQYATVKAGGNEYIRLAYCLSSVASGNVTYTMTQAAGGGHTIHVFEMSSSIPLSLDTIDASGTGIDTTMESGDETSVETSMVAFGAGGHYRQSTYVSATLDGVAVDQATDAQDTGYLATGLLTMRVMNNPGTYNSIITVSVGDYTWMADLIAFKEAGGKSFIASGSLRMIGSILRRLRANRTVGGSFRYTGVLLRKFKTGRLLTGSFTWVSSLTKIFFPYTPEETQPVRHAAIVIYSKRLKTEFKERRNVGRKRYFIPLEEEYDYLLAKKSMNDMNQGEFEKWRRQNPRT